MKTSLDFFDHIGTIFDHLLSSQGTLSPTRQNTILHEMSFLSTFAEQSASNSRASGERLLSIYSHNV